MGELSRSGEKCTHPGLYPGVPTSDYLKNNTEADIGLSYLIERSKKRQRRYQAAKDGTAQTRSMVASRDIAEYAYHRGGLALIDFLDAERSYRAAELAYRQALASYLLALKQLREGVATRNLP